MTPEQFLKTSISTRQLPTYVYGYPSKRTYRQFSSPLTVSDILEETGESKRINIYLHIPFCRYRCTYCTLFLTTKHNDDLKQAYVDRLVEHIKGYGRYLSGCEVDSIYFGGGTPTLLTPAQFEAIFNALHEAFPKWSAHCEVTVEGAPDCIDDDLLDSLKSLGVNRMSMGIQSMEPGELAHSGRPYPVDVAHRSIQALLRRFDHINLDLIYGLRSQTRESWEHSLNSILEYNPATLSLYPVVVRPLTNIEKVSSRDPNLFFSEDEKYEAYDENVKKLRAASYRQESFTRFTRIEAGDAYQQEASDFDGVPLLGLGAGARSYFGRYHFSTDYAVNRTVALDIIRAYADRPFDPDAIASHGIALSTEDLERRYVLLSLTLSRLNRERYRTMFGRDIEALFSEPLSALTSAGLVDLQADGTYALTDNGFKYSSIMARLFYSDDMLKLEQQYQAA